MEEYASYDPCIGYSQPSRWLLAEYALIHAIDYSQPSRWLPDWIHVHSFKGNFKVCCVILRRTFGI